MKKNIVALLAVLSVMCFASTASAMPDSCKAWFGTWTFTYSDLGTASVTITSGCSRLDGVCEGLTIYNCTVHGERTSDNTPVTIAQVMFDATTFYYYEMAAPTSADPSDKIPNVAMPWSPFTATTVSLTLVSGTKISPAPTSRRASDFNNNEKSDILWQNSSSSELYLQEMDSRSITNQNYITSSVGWNAVATADFNNDGIADIVEQSAGTGAIRIKMMSGDGTVIAATNYISTTQTGTAWAVVGTGDFNDDWNKDLLLENTTTGDIDIVELQGDGATVLAEQVIVQNATSATAMVAGIGDFNGDGSSDILVRDTSNGYNTILLMTGLTIKAQTMYYVEANTNWVVKGIGDFNADGNSDIVWQNTSTGWVWLQQMNGTAILRQRLIYVEANTAWQVIGVGDFNNDNKADVLWRNNSTGLVYMMLMGGTATNAGFFIGSSAPCYQEADMNWHAITK